MLLPFLLPQLDRRLEGGTFEKRLLQPLALRVDLLEGLLALFPGFLKGNGVFVPESADARIR